MTAITTTFRYLKIHLQFEHLPLPHKLNNHRIIYIGETHTNLLHHKVQFDIIRELERRSPGKIAVGMEMFNRSSQQDLDLWSRGELDEKTFEKLWYANWTQDFDYYKEILHFVRHKGIPLIALNIPNEHVSIISQSGIDELPEEIRETLPEIDTTDPYHRKRMEGIFQGHAPGKGGFDNFYETMLLWDETMAESIVNYISGPEARGKKLIVLAGGGHISYGFGIPRRVFRRLPEAYVSILPHTPFTQIPHEKKEYVLMENVIVPELPLYVADFIWAVGYKDLVGTKVRLGVGIEPSEQGVMILSVAPESAALKAGIIEGDVITSFGGETVAEPFDLVYFINKKNKGDTVVINIVREGEVLELKVNF